GEGGGVYTITGAALITNCTFSANVVTYGSGGLGGSPGGGNGNPGTAAGGGIARNTGTLTLANSILAYTSGGANGSGTLLDAGYNISSDSFASLTNSHSINSTDPKLDVIGYNGGYTLTVPLLAGSPAINAGNPTNTPPQDERGYYRNGSPDIGAYEYNGAPLGVTEYPV